MNDGVIVAHDISENKRKGVVVTLQAGQVTLVRLLAEITVGFECLGMCFSDETTKEEKESHFLLN